jgi:hypothetical protein
MVSQADFTAEEWQLLLEAPVLAGMAVTAAEPSGVWGLLKESLAAGGALARARTDAAANPLVKAVADAYAGAEGRTAAREGLRAQLGSGPPGELKQKAIAGMARALAVVAAKDAADAAAFRDWLEDTARHVAEASTEGGFLGFGGVRVSDAEKATLAEIETALRAIA